MSFQVVFHHCTAKFEQKVNDLVKAFARNDFELEVKSSGSTGKPKVLKHPKAHLLVSAERSNTFFRLNRDSRTLCPVSFDTIGGKMSLIRALAGNYEIHFVEAERAFIEKINPELTFNLVSVAPIQLSWIVENCGNRLKQFENILVGGASVSESLEKRSIELNPNCYLGFGMTETISHIALRKFGNETYQLLPGISIAAEENGVNITDHQTGLEIHSSDLIEQIDKQQFKWIGRADFVINSGGIKIHPDQLESFIQNKLQLQIVIIGKTDSEYGEKVVLVSENELPVAVQAEIKELIELNFGKYAVPKLFIVHSFSYLNGLKLDRRTLKTEIDRIS